MRFPFEDSILHLNDIATVKGHNPNLRQGFCSGCDSILFKVVEEDEIFICWRLLEPQCTTKGSISQGNRAEKASLIKLLGENFEGTFK
jgi:hypothetical protein